MKKKSNNIYRTIFLLLIFISLVSFCTLKAIENVQHNYKQTILLQIYSMYSQNLLLAEENLSNIKCYITDKDEYVNKECSAFYDEFMFNIPVVEYCKSNGIDNNCIPEYKVSAKTPKNCDSLYEKLVYKQADSIVLKNNKLMLIASDDKYKYPFFAIDINGKENPNVIGEDLVIVALRKDMVGKYYIDMNASICTNKK